jgi:AraC-like DNA-binding protein
MYDKILLIQYCYHNVQFRGYPKIMASDQASPLDRLSGLLERFRVKAHLFHSGTLCGLSSFAAEPDRGFLHVLRRGEMQVTHRRSSGIKQRIFIKEPTLLFYPRPLAHDFHNAPSEGADLTCASISFDGGERHPLVRALPALIVLPLREVEGLGNVLTLLFAEADRVRCGHRLLADRLFEVVLLQLLRWMLDHPQESGVSNGLMSGLADPGLARALTAMHEQPGHPWSLECLAVEAGMSRTAFSNKFKETVGSTALNYLTDWRISIAQAQLRSGQAVKFIAEELGYANPSALSRVFTQRVGASPRSWLKGSKDTGNTGLAS